MLQIEANFLPAIDPRCLGPKVGYLVVFIPDILMATFCLGFHTVVSLYTPMSCKVYKDSSHTELGLEKLVLP